MEKAKLAYDAGEIMRKYNHEPTGQTIAILAQLNECARADIAAVIVENGGMLPPRCTVKAYEKYREKDMCQNRNAAYKGKGSTAKISKPEKKNPAKPVKKKDIKLPAPPESPGYETEPVIRAALFHELARLEDEEDEIREKIKSILHDKEILAERLGIKTDEEEQERKRPDVDKGVHSDSDKDGVISAV